jgi:hypothetical protein
VLLRILSDLTTSMAIKNGEKSLVLVEIEVRNMCVFLIK